MLFYLFIFLIKDVFMFLLSSGQAASFDSDPMLVSAQYHIHTHGVFRGLQVSRLKQHKHTFKAINE